MYIFPRTIPTAIRLLLWGGSVALSLCVSPLSHSAASAAAPASNDAALEEIIVTSRKREESLQEVPISVTALSAKTLEDRSLPDFNSLSNVVPNVEINTGQNDGGGSAAQVFIRGIGQLNYAFPNDPGVGVYIDGVYVSRSSAGDFAFMGIQRIEVLRGPQGTLYGKNTIGGAINIVTSKPTMTDEGYAEVTYGSFNRLEFTGMANFVASDSVAIRLDGFSRSIDGYGRDFLGDPLAQQEKTSARIQALWTGSNDTSALFETDYSRQVGTGPVGAVRTYFPGAIPGLVNTYIAPAAAAQYNLKPPYNVLGPAWVNDIDETHNFTNGTVDQTKDDNQVFGTAFTLNWMIGGVTAKSISAFRQIAMQVLRQSDQTPFDYVPVPVNERDQQISEEFQFTGDALNGRLSFVTGIFAINETGKNSFEADIIEGVYNAIGLDISLLTHSHIDTTSVAAYGEANYKLTDRLSITAGARVHTEQKDYTYEVSRVFTGAPVVPYGQYSARWNEFLPKLGLQYQFTDDVMAYFTGAKGFKAGGWNPYTLTPGETPQKFDPESIITYELGLKTQFAENRITLNSDVFYSDYKDIQLSAITQTTLPDGTVSINTTINNAGRGKIYGAEFELSAHPVSPLRLSAGLGLLHTEYTQLGESVIAAGTATLSDQFIDAPKVTVNGSAEYRVALPYGSLTLFTDVEHKSSIERSVQNFPDLVTNPYTLWNGRVTFAPPDEKHYKVAFFVKNITDKIYMTNGLEDSALGYTEAYYSRPREYGVSVSSRF